MKYGVADYGMNVWFGGNYDLADRLANLKAIGFDGIERLEATDAADAVARAAEFRKLGMDFATVRMGNVAQSMLYTAAFGKDYTWLVPGSCSRDVKLDVFVRRTKEFCKACAKFNITAAIHNHLGNTIESQEELDYLMREVPEATLLLDIGHLAGANGNVLGPLEKYYDENAEAWTSRLRFCELGGGNKPGFVDWQGTAEFLRAKGYDKWVLVEHDTHLQDPYIDLKTSLDALKAILD